MIFTHLSRPRRCRLLLASVVLCPSMASAAGNPEAVMEPLSLTHLLQVLGSLILVLLVFVGLVMLMKRFSGLRGVSGGRLRIIEALPLGTRDRLLLVQLGDKQLLLGQSPGRIQALHVLEHALPVDDASGADSPFASSLRNAAGNILSGGAGK